VSKKAIPTYFFVLVVVRLGHRFLLVRERKHGQLWYLPAGRVEAGESLAQAARRETLEEAGIHIEPEGILRVEHTPMPGGGARVRVFMVARPVDDTPPKSEPDGESLGATWATLDELHQFMLRDPEVADAIDYVASGSTVMPISMLCEEGSRWAGTTLTRRMLED
jgi:phosphatase NudJ